ncbi:MAG: chloride channel protein [Planctomycetota bacterium]
MASVDVGPADPYPNPTNKPPSQHFKAKAAAWLRGLWEAPSLLIPVAAVIGTFAGVAAVGFDAAIEACRRISFGMLDYAEHPLLDALLIVLLPTLGGLLVGLIQSKGFRATRREPGVPSVIEALAKQRGQVPATMGVSKAVTASITIGSGGSAGVEGPILTIGATVASRTATLLHLPQRHAPTLVGCGAAAGTAAIFNAPIAGVIFVLEVVLRDFSVRTFMPIVVASVFGVAVTQAMLGQNEAVFTLPETMTRYTFSFAELLPYAALGILAGGAGALFTLGLPACEKQWDRVKLPAWSKPAIGGALLGVLGVGFLLFAGSPMPAYEAPVFFGNGYPVIEAMLNPQTYANREAGMVLLIIVFGCKLVGTFLTLGSGGSGGIVAPALFLGAALGGVVGLTAQHVGWLPVDSPATYALAGMAGVLAAVAHCPLAAFLLVFELTADYQVILPMMLVSILATTTAQKLAGQSIYGHWLAKRGIRTGTYADLTLLRRMTVREVPLAPAVLVQPDDPATRLLELARDFAATDYVVCTNGETYTGLVVGEDVRKTLAHHHAATLMIVSELMRTNLATVTQDETLDAVMDKFARHEVASLAVVDGSHRVKGVITRPRLMREYQHALERQA